MRAKGQAGEWNRAEAITLASLVLLAAAIRAAFFPANQNFYGDAVVRTELALEWLRSPHWIASFRDGAQQFGPLHLYLIAATEKLLSLQHPLADAGRWLSFAVGSASVIPLYALTRQLAGSRAAVWAALILCLWAMHVQLSTTAASEALGMFILLSCLWAFSTWMDRQSWGGLVTAGALLTLLAAVRFDAWLLIPLLSGVVWLQDRTRNGAGAALAFAGICLIFPGAWLLGNAEHMGDPFYPIHEVQAFHRAWTSDGVHRYGEGLYRLHNLLFWPGAAVVTLSPWLALVAGVGMVSTWRASPSTRWAIAVALLPAVYFTFSSAVRLTFVPLARFTCNQLVLLLPYLYSGFAVVFSRFNARTSMRAASIGVLFTLLWHSALAVYPYRSESRMAIALRPVSARSRNPKSVVDAAQLLRRELKTSSGLIVLDADPNYLDLQVAALSELPRERFRFARWARFDSLSNRRKVDAWVLIAGGRLAERLDLQSADARWTELPPSLRIVWNSSRSSANDAGETKDVR